MPMAALAISLLLAGVTGVQAQSNLVIESFELPGRIAFTKVTNATHYRVEWSAADVASWTNFGAPELDAIESPGVGIATASVPVVEPMMQYRVVATVALPPAATFPVVLNSETNAYVIAGQTNPALQLIRGQTYVFEVNTPGQPLWIKTRTVTGRADAYTNGLSTNGISSGPITFVVPMDAPDTLYYISQFRSALQGVIQITDTPPMPSGPTNMVLIPAGGFMMGNATNVFPNEGGNDELPQRLVTVSAFYMDQYEVTKALWDQVRAWATTQGFDLAIGGGKGMNHPVHSANWYDAVKWCNARSEREGLTPVYYTDAGFTTVYRSGNLFEPHANWAADGYRLPTEAEWEKAARGGTTDTRFPWIDFTNKISWSKANYFGRSSSLSYDLSGTGGAFHPTYDNGAWPWTSPVGSFAPNGYGVYDMAGNIQEWCWDWYDPSYYASSPGMDPRGPASPVPGAIDETGTKPGLRVLRGGSWASDASGARIARRLFYTPQTPQDYRGFRCVRPVP